MPFCRNCGKEVKDGAKFCAGCGTPTGVVTGTSGINNSVENAPDSTVSGVAAGAESSTPAVNNVAVSEPVITSDINSDDVELDEPDFNGLSNKWAWCLAFVPLMVSVLAVIIVAVAHGLVHPSDIVGIGCIPLFFLFYMLDNAELKKNNIKFGWGWIVWGILLCGFLVGPIYLFRRAKNTGKYGYAFASLIPIVGVLLIVAVSRFSEVSEEANLARVAQFVTTFSDDRDGKVYKKITVGSQTWMAENLNYEAEASECYELEADNCAKYGRLYNWETALKACPAGWHLPSNAEWETLGDYVGGWKTAGKKLKSIRGWDDDWGSFDLLSRSGHGTGNGTDKYGFSALPGGRGHGDGKFLGAGSFGNWWSATECDTGLASLRGMENFSKYMGSFCFYKTFLLSVRCVQD